MFVCDRLPGESPFSGTRREYSTIGRSRIFTPTGNLAKIHTKYIYYFQKQKLVFTPKNTKINRKSTEKCTRFFFKTGYNKSVEFADLVPVSY